MTDRTIRTSTSAAREELADALQGLFVAELLAPSQPLYIITPWISDVPLIDNRTARFSGLLPDLPQRWIRLSELLLKHMDGQLSEEFEACDMRDGDDSADDCKGQAVTIYVRLLAAACDPGELDALKQFWTMFDNNFSAVAPGLDASKDEKSDWHKSNVLKLEAFTKELCPSRSQRTAELGIWISENYS